MEEKINRKKVRLLVRKFGGGDSNEVQSNLSVKNCISHFFVLRLFFFSLRPCWSFTLACSHPLTLLQMSSVIGAETCRRCFRELSPSMTFFQVLAIFFWRAGFKNISKILSEKVRITLGKRWIDAAAGLEMNIEEMGLTWQQHN